MAGPVFRGIDPPDQYLILQTLAEVRNGLVIRHQPTSQPHHLNIAASLPFQTTARLHPVEVAVDVELQQNRGMIPWTARRLGRGATKTKTA
jgi:hypothetical protein